MKIIKTNLPRLIIVDSTEKCAGTSLKHILRINFEEKNFFDLDNGDPPSEKIRNYGIQCNIFFTDFSKELNNEQSNFYYVYNRYINKRAEWLIDNIDKYKLKCIYGNGINATRLLEVLNKKYEIFYCKFFREPADRVAAEYYYVLTNKDHNLHHIAKMSKNLYEYSSNKLRPKNRQVLSIKGKNTHLKVNDLKKRIKENYKFVGFLSNFENDVNSLSKILNLKYSKNIKRNQTRKSENNRILNNKFISLIKKNDSEDYEIYKFLVENKKNINQ